MGLVIVLFEMGEVMEHIAHYELVEEDDTQQGHPSDDSGHNMARLGYARVGVFFFLFNGLNEVVGLHQLQQVEDNCDYSKEE